MLIRIGCLFIIVALLVTCQTRMHGPNYSKSDRMKAVLKEDIRMKKAMIRARKRATPRKK